MIAIRTGTEISNRPGAELVIHGERHKIHARTADASEKAELWPKIVAAYKGYAGYQQRTDREIRW